MNQCQMSGRMKSVEEEEGIEELPLGLGGEWWMKRLRRLYGLENVDNLDEESFYLLFESVWKKCVLFCLFA